MRPRQAIAAVLLLLPLTAPVSAEEGYEGPRTVSMGGALRAAAVSTPALYVNPGALALGGLFHVEAAYQYHDAVQGHLTNAAVVDSTTPVAGGFGVTYAVSDPEHADRTFYDLRLGLAMPLGQALSLGGTIKYLYLGQDGTPRSGATVAAADDGQLLDDVTFDLGAVLRLGSVVSLGVTGHNLTGLGTPEAPLKLGLGAAVSLASVAVIGVDAVLDLVTYDKTVGRYGIGAEYFAANRYPLRLGYSLDPEVGDHFVSGGVGYVDPRFAADAALRQQVAGGMDTMVTVAVRFFVY